MPSSTSSDRLAYSIEEVAELIGISRSLVYDILNDGRLGYLKVGRRRIITIQQLAAFLQGAETAA